MLTSSSYYAVGMFITLSFPQSKQPVHKLFNVCLEIEYNLVKEVKLTQYKSSINKLRTAFSTDNISCFLFSECSGCQLQKNVRLPPIWKELEKFFVEKGIFPELVSKEIIHYRSKVKLAVRGSFLDPKIGLFKEGTHEVVDIPSCPLHYPVMDKACALIKQKITEYKIAPYEEKRAQGRLRYIQMVVNQETNKVQLSLVFNSNSLMKNELDFIEDIYSNNPIWHSIWVNFLQGSTNTILGNKWELLCGEEDFWQKLLGIEFCFHSSCFSQAHLSVFEEMLQYLAFLVPEKKNILELYAGVGCIGLYLAQKSSKVVFIESSPKAEECFKKTLSKLPDEVSSKCTFFSSSVEDIDFLNQEIDLLIVDPPRKGLSKKCKEKIDMLQPKEFIYVSCGPSSFMRDCEELLKKGWILDQARGFLLFPGTDHAEIVAKFVKS